MSPALIMAMRLFVVLMKVKEGGLDAKAKAKFEKLKAQFTPMLPPPPNGVAWEAEDLDELADSHEEAMKRIEARHRRTNG